MQHKLTNEINVGASPAYYAAQEGRLEVLEFMHEKCKCDVSAACNDGLKPIHAASQCGHTNIVKVITIHYYNRNTFFIITTVYCSPTGQSSHF